MDSSSSSSSQRSPAPELPGFYYDPEKNRYFRLLPGHNNCNPLTKESIQQREMESKRLKLLEEDQQSKKTIRTGLNSLFLLQKRQLGLLSSTSYCRRVHELKANCMKRQKVTIRNPEFCAGTGADHFQLMLADATSERAFMVKNDTDQGGYKFGIINLDSLWKGHFRLKMCDNFYFLHSKISSACWASVTHPDSHLLLCIMGIAENPGSVTLLPVSYFSNTLTRHRTNSQSLATEWGEDRPEMLSNINIPIGWSCAWSLNPQAHNYFSTGLTRRVYVTNVATGHRQIFSTDSDVLAQQFATQSPVLYNGCRSGEIFSVDIRQHIRKGCSRKCSHFFHDSAVTSLKVLQDENYLMVADMAGKIKLWDLRTMNCVIQYEGHNNQYAHLPLHVNEEEGLLLAVGQDCYTRIWNLQDSHLLRTIPSPHPTSKDSIPNVVFSSRLGGKRGVPGLLMAVKQDLFYFSYNTDTQS
ncbi:DDB1- and CUL4-associated factor 4 isoform X2 [Rhinatrema bivittatum]|uniref:DDB1- and CUL4-associated factor 4 isoform X2 n=1 Tax=Rhinatrema bivittatum TaxID=194408 RepID=UPI00112C19F2|nr:DDB1- and CUL4-associated factor 4 isoform X2 [Rhinatrema bivittatum]